MQWVHKCPGFYRTCLPLGYSFIRCIISTSKLNTVCKCMKNHFKRVGLSDHPYLISRSGIINRLMLSFPLVSGCSPVKFKTSPGSHYHIPIATNKTLKAQSSLMLIAIYEVSRLYWVTNYQSWGTQLQNYNILTLRYCEICLKSDRVYPIVWDWTEVIIRLEVNYLSWDIGYKKLNCVQWQLLRS